jgi:hypothetical protein
LETQYTLPHPRRENRTFATNLCFRILAGYCTKHDDSTFSFIILHYSRYVCIRVVLWSNLGWDANYAVKKSDFFFFIVKLSF